MTVSTFLFLLIFVVLSLWLWALTDIVRGLITKVDILSKENEALYKLMWKYMSISEGVSTSPTVSSSEPPSPSYEPVDDPWETNDINDYRGN